MCVCVESSRMIPQSTQCLLFPYSRLTRALSLARSLADLNWRLQSGVGIRAEDGERLGGEMMRKTAGNGRDIQTHRVGGSTEEGKRGIARENERAKEWR